MKNDASVEPGAIRRMFDEIAPAYDRLNHLLSFGLDAHWRRRAVRELAGKKGGRFLDIAAGTGDSSLAMLRASPRHLVALDFAFKPLLIAREKFRIQTSSVINAMAGDAMRLPFKPDSFDAVFIAFGIRNFEDKSRSLREIARVLRLSGIVCILELSRPKTPLFAQLFRFYFHAIVPFVGRLLSGHANAYRYLPQSVDTFPDPPDFVSSLRNSGFRTATSHRLTFGSVMLYVGIK